MRWARTAATTLSSITAALLIIWGGLVWLVEPRFYEWAQSIVDASTETLASDLERSTEHLDRLDMVVERLEENVSRLSETAAQSTAASWRFDPVETAISDGPIGGFVTIRAAGFKLRDCGVPTVDLYFVNGGGVYHRFVEASVLSSGGRGIALPVMPTRLQSLTYTARIPTDDGVSPGRALGYISITYPDACPAVEPAVAGPLQFRITS